MTHQLTPSLQLTTEHSASSHDIPVLVRDKSQLTRADRLHWLAEVCHRLRCRLRGTRTDTGWQRFGSVDSEGYYVHGPADVFEYGGQFQPAAHHVVRFAKHHRDNAALQAAAAAFCSQWPEGPQIETEES